MAAAAAAPPARWPVSAPAALAATAPDAKKAGTTGHQGRGSLVSIDAKSGAAIIKHEPIASLGWPAMSMEFALANAAVASGVKPGSAIAFEFVERKPGEWVITKMDATAAAKPITPAVAPALADPHKGH